MKIRVKIFNEAAIPKAMPSLVGVPIKPVPRDFWPVWVKAMAINAAATDSGVGDTVERIIGKPVSEAFKAWYLASFGHSCGCSERQRRWNSLYPYA